MSHEDLHYPTTTEERIRALEAEVSRYRSALRDIKAIRVPFTLGANKGTIQSLESRLKTIRAIARDALGDDLTLGEEE